MVKKRVGRKRGICTIFSRVLFSTHYLGTYDRREGCVDIHISVWLNVHVARCIQWK